MGTINKRLLLLLTLLLALSGVPFQSTFAAANDYVTVTKSVNPTTISTAQEAEVTLNIQGTPPVSVVQPNDVMLIIDKSGSMAPSANNGEDKMKAAKEAANGFIDLMDLTKHQVGIVDFSSSTLTKTFPLSTDGSAVKQYVDSINANGSTATGYAIEQAIKELENHRPEARPVIVIMTDGDATEPSQNPYDYAKQWAQTAKDAGITFYTIALLKSTDDPETSGPNQLLKEMATTSSHHHFVLGSKGLQEIYAAIVKEIGMASAYDVVVSDVVSPDFEVVPGSYDGNIPKPTVNGNQLTWKFTELKNSMLSFTYKIKPKDRNKTGNLAVSTSSSIITYKDYAGASRSKAIPILTVQVKYPAPIVTSIENSFGHPNGGETVTITGSNFRAGATVKFGDKLATNVQVVDSTKITAVTPANVQGTSIVTVTNLDGQKATASYQYKADPIVTSVEPNHGPLASGTLVIFNGKYFMNGITVKFGDTVAPINTFTSSTYFKVNAPIGAAPGPVDVVLTNVDGTTLTIPKGYTYDAPPVEELAVTKISPNTGDFGGGELVYIDGKKFATGIKVYFGTSEAPVVTYNSDTRIKVQAPGAIAAGPVDVKVVNPDGSTVKVKDGYTYNPAPVLPAPEISLVNPASGLLAGGDSVTIDGKNFVKGLKVYFATDEAQVSSFVSSSRIIVKSPAVTSAGMVDVKVVNPDNQQATKTQGYIYLAAPEPIPPTITSITPNSGSTVGGTVIYIDGSNFVQGLKVYFGTTEGTVTTFYSSSRIKVTSPAVTTGGEVDVKVINPDGLEAVKSKGFTFIAPPPPGAPIIKQISPNSSLLAGGTVVYIDGENFVQGLKVYFGANEAPLQTYYSSIRIKVTAPASTVEGAVDVKIVNPDSQEGIKGAGFSYVAPPPEPVEITNISPNKGLTAGGELVTIDGVNFKQGAVVKFGSTPVNLDYYYSSNRVRVKAPSSNGVSGPVDVTLTNPDGQTFTFAQGYTYDEPTPELTNVSPNHGPMSGGTVIYVDGKNFEPNMTLTINGTPTPITTYYGSTRFKFTTPSSSTSGNVSIIVTLPSGKTATGSFTYDAPPPAAAPVITKINPTYGPVAGGTIIYVDGTGFQNGLKVYFDGVEGSIVTYYSSIRVKIKSPAAAGPGTFQIKIVNPDGQESNTIPFEYR
ncbi:IPT/TIG domain-containing protein [Brevibacillus centrosporus]|uniref:IPT/TIG domain-containing protein n=1 Tax=Brevibacillus centrosporus TaxID=54910 RepID=UPI003D1EAF80